MSRLVVGIDEAGRGPVVGPMVVAGLVLNEETLEALRVMGVRDSKKLTRQQRERLAPLLESIACHVVVAIVPPEVLDAFNLNEVEARVFSFVISRVCSVWSSVDRIVVDAVGPPAKLKRVLERVSCGQLVVEAKADERYVEASAASVVAKVVRDREIDKLREEYGVRGSGYPTDPETIQWIKEEYARNPSRPPPFVRRTWKTLKQLAPGWYVDKESLMRGIRGRSLLDYLRSRNSSEP